MPRYFFHVDDGTFLPDAEGSELAGIDEARVEAVKMSGAILREFGRKFWMQNTPWRLHVTDAENQLLFTLHFSADEPSGKLFLRPVEV